MFTKEDAIRFVDEKHAEFEEISHKIWEYAELSLKEHKSAALYVEALKKEGFEIETGVCNIETAFLGKAGSGRPYIGILGEFDALSGLSQKGCCTEKQPLVKGASGHGCGHNMLGAAAFGAAVAVKKYLEETGKQGTVIFYGCPGEEGGSSKTFMAREGLWKELDCALTWHPGDVNEVETGTCNSTIQTLYKFSGQSAHAAGDPEDGRSALDAVELMNVGIQFLREHVKTDARIHYAIINAGGISPNVVQDSADVLYMVRSCKVRDLIALQKRVDKIAEGAAMMTETSFEKIIVDGSANTVPNHVLEKLYFDNMSAIPVPEYTEEEWEFAKKIKSTYNFDYVPALGAQEDPDIEAFVREKTNNMERALNDFVVPLYSGNHFMAGSTDVGDVSWLTPTAQFNTVCYPSCAPGHSWQIVSSGLSTIGDKGMLYAAKIMCATAIDLFEKPEILKDARTEFEAKTKEGYLCPVPDGVPPYIIED